MPESLPVVLVPGLGGSARIWLPVVPALWAHGTVVLANHLQGENIPAIAARILAEAPPRFALAGHSLGGYIAFEIMRQAPERVARLALVNTQARPDNDEALARRRGMIERIEAGGFDAGVAALYPGFVHPSRHDDAALRQLVTDLAYDVGPQAFVRQLRAIMARVDSRPTLATIKCPTLVLTSDTDNTLPKPLSEEIAAGIPGARLVVLTDCGHLPMIERPEATAQVLAEWLAN